MQAMDAEEEEMTGAETMRLLYVFATDSFEQVEYRFTPATPVSPRSNT